MNPEVENSDWDGVEKRQTRRRYTLDRRVAERRKKYFWSVVFPIVLGAVLSGLLSWGVYVTHVTYRISAGYEETFVKHLEMEVEKDKILEHKLELMKAEYTGQMRTIRAEMAQSLKEIRDMQMTMYRLLLDHERTEREKDGDNR